jgi:hypothetical protein
MRLRAFAQPSSSAVLEMTSRARRSSSPIRSQPRQGLSIDEAAYQFGRQPRALGNGKFQKLGENFLTA